MKTPTRTELEAMPLEKLKQKAGQHWEMAGAARLDGDFVDEKRHMKLARLYESQLNKLKG